MMGLGGFIGALGTWDLLFDPFVLKKLPPLGALALPLVIIGLLCLSLMVVAWAYALLAKLAVIRIDLDKKTLRKELHLVGNHVLSKSWLLSHVTRMWVDENPDSEATQPWRIMLSTPHDKYPAELNSYTSEAEANRTITQWRTSILQKSGFTLPS